MGFSEARPVVLLAIALTAWSHLVTFCSAVPILIGDWRWGADGTVSPYNGQASGNYARDLYHGIEVNGVVTSDGVLQVRSDTEDRSPADYYGDAFIRVGTIDDLAGLAQMMWTFEDVTFLDGGATANSWFLAGSVKPAAFSDPEHLFWIGISRNATTGTGNAKLYLWDGANNYVSTSFNMGELTLQTQAYDLQFEFDATGGSTDNVIFRMRDASATDWTTELAGSNPVSRINGPPTWEVAIGKNRPGSSTTGDMNMGRVTLHIPEPATGAVCMFLVAGVAMLRIRYRHNERSER